MEDPNRRIARWLFAVAFLFMVVGCTYPVLAAPAHNPRPQPTAANTSAISAVKPPRYQEAAIAVVEATPTPEPAPEPTVVPTPVPTVVVVRAPIYSGSHEEWMAAAGIPQSDYGYVDFIVSHEGGWCATRWNGQRGACLSYMAENTFGSGAYGLCQALPASKLASAGEDWQTNPITQLRWCHSYAQSRYGGWYASYLFWQKSRWW